MEIEDIKKISLREGDVLLVQMPDGTGVEHIRRMHKLLKQVIPDNEIIFTSKEYSFSSITKGEACVCFGSSMTSCPVHGGVNE